MLEKSDSLVTEVQAQLRDLPSGGDPSPEAATISRNLFKVAEILAMVVSNASRQMLAMQEGDAQHEFAVGILERMSRIRSSMERVNRRLRSLQGTECLPEGQNPTLLN